MYNQRRSAPLPNRQLYTHTRYNGANPRLDTIAYRAHLRERAEARRHGGNEEQPYVRDNRVWYGSFQQPNVGEMDESAVAPILTEEQKEAEARIPPENFDVSQVRRDLRNAANQLNNLPPFGNAEIIDQRRTLEDQINGLQRQLDELKEDGEMRGAEDPDYDDRWGEDYLDSNNPILTDLERSGLYGEMRQTLPVNHVADYAYMITDLVEETGAVDSEIQDEDPNFESIFDADLQLAAQRGYEEAYTLEEREQLNRGFVDDAPAFFDDAFSRGHPSAQILRRGDNNNPYQRNARYFYRPDAQPMGAANLRVRGLYTNQLGARARNFRTNAEQVVQNSLRTQGLYPYTEEAARGSFVRRSRGARY